MGKLIRDYIYYVRLGYGLRESWKLAKVTL